MHLFGSNAAIDLLGDIFQGKVRCFHRVMVQIVMVAVSFLMGYYGIRMIGVMMVRSSAALGIPMGYVYFSIPIGCFGMMLQCLANIMDLVDQEKGVRA